MAISEGVDSSLLEISNLHIKMYFLKNNTLHLIKTCFEQSSTQNGEIKNYIEKMFFFSA